MSRPKKVILLGSTGSIGTSALKVAKQLPEEIEIIGLAAGNSDVELAQQALEYGVKHVCIFNETKAKALESKLPVGTKVYSGESGLVDIATLEEADMILVAIVGTTGLKPTLAAIEAGKDIAVASKEILVMAGEIVMRSAKKYNTTILPIDSEHNAIFQCLEKEGSSTEVNRLILTASGGPFKDLPKDKFAGIKPSEALAHPTWDMGRKISIDSASMFNKGLEMIEARWLFDIPLERIDVVVHPQSIIHSMVEFIDGSVLAQMSQTDMCFPIQYAVTYPRRIRGGLNFLDFTQLSQLTFEKPRYEDFPALEIAIEAGKLGGAIPAIMNAANEVAVDAFLKEQITFPQIWQSVEETISICSGASGDSIEALISADNEARLKAAEIINTW